MKQMLSFLVVLTIGFSSISCGGKEEDKSDLSSKGAANCYIVSASGAYRFKLVKGNTLEPVGEVSSVKVLWESFGTDVKPNVGDLIKSVSFADGYVHFQTADTFKEGNAVIAARDCFGDILWSWHIWLTDEPRGQEYFNGAGTMMDRNLGATSATPGEVGALGLLYQWGRKDPFLGSSSLSHSVLAKSTISWPYARKRPNSNAEEYADSHPTTFILSRNSYLSGSVGGQWTELNDKKSVSDPCPFGWRVPEGGYYGVWGMSSGTSEEHMSYDWASDGMNFSQKFGSARTIWYPSAGCRYSNSGDLGRVGDYGWYWSCSSSLSDSRPVNLSICNDGDVYMSDTSSYTAGLSVRCVKAKEEPPIQ